MAEFDGTFCFPFLPSVLIIEGVGVMGGGVGWGGTGRGGTWQKLPFKTPHEQPRYPHSGQ